MTIRQFQKKISDALNRLEALVQGGCKAFAEDTMGIGYEIGRCLNEGGVSVVVVTPRLQRNGDRAGTLPMECTLAVQCTEKPALNREVPGHLTALDAAEIVAHALDGHQFCLVSIDQTAEERTRTITATASFNTTIHLTND